MLNNSAHGFTLIELLVLITIISILASLLLPAIAMVRSASSKVRCASNLRQLGIAVMVYADNYQGQAPLVYDDWSKRSNYMFTNYYNGICGFGMLYYAGVFDTPLTFFCPKWSGTSHGFQGPNNPWPPQRITRAGFGLRPEVSMPVRKFVGPLPRLDTYGSTSAIGFDMVHHRSSVEKGHKSGCNVVYGDGHVSYVPLNRFRAPLESFPSSRVRGIDGPGMDAIVAAFDAFVAE